MVLNLSPWSGSSYRIVAVALGVAMSILFAPSSSALADDASKVLEERMAKEKAERKGCKVSICDVARNKKAEGEDLACSVVKTWTADELKAKFLRGKFDWPWSAAQCGADIKLPRRALAEALTPGEHDVKLDKHTLKCTLDQKEGTDKYSIAFSLQPSVHFKDGKAVKTVLNWSNIEGTAIAKGAVWSAATLDNNVGVFEGAASEAVNEFFGLHCDEFKDELGK